MATLDGVTAAKRMLAMRTNIPGRCLQTVGESFGNPHTIGASPGRWFATALDAWEYSDTQHRGDRTPPEGAVCYFGVSPTRTDANRAAGDVTIFYQGRLVATDYPRNGVIGRPTIQQRSVETARPYLGWCADFCGNPIRFATTASVGVTKIVSPKPKVEEEEMKPFQIYIKNKNGTMQWALISGDLKTFAPLFKSDTANAFSTHGPATGPAIEVVKAEWNGFRAAAGLAADNTVG